MNQKKEDAQTAKTKRNKKKKLDLVSNQYPHESKTQLQWSLENAFDPFYWSSCFPREQDDRKLRKVSGLLAAAYNLPRYLSMTVKHRFILKPFE